MNSSAPAPAPAASDTPAAEVLGYTLWTVLQRDPLRPHVPAEGDVA